jgi:two-component system NtrC family response regulator
MQKVLLIKENGDGADALRNRLEHDHYAVTQTKGISAALREIERGTFDHVVTDSVPDAEAARALMQCALKKGADWTIMSDPRQTVGRALRAIPLDRDHIVFEPVAEAQMFEADPHAGMHLSFCEPRAQVSAHSIGAPLRLCGVSAGMWRVRAEIERAAGQATGVLVTGEPGSGKRAAAREIHLRSVRAAQPFVVVDCAAIPTALFDSVLFGSGDVAGRAELAQGGTLVLEEPSLLPLRIQHKILDLMQKKHMLSASGAALIPDFMLIGSSRRALIEFVARGEFDETLYDRLREVDILLPPLRTRREDIALLAEYFRAIFNERLSLNVQRFEAAALLQLAAYAWPENITEFQRVLESAFLACRGPVLTVEHLPHHIQSVSEQRAVHKRPHASAQQQELIDVLNWAGWNKSKAARRLGISRETLYRRMLKFALTGLAEAQS